VVVKRQPIKQPVKAAPRPDAAKKPFTMRHLWRMTLWAGTAAGALLVAVLTTRSEVGAERVATAFPSLRTHDRVQLAARSFDAQAETRRLAATVHDLSAENDQLQSRLAAVEQNMNDITGSISRQIEAVKEAETANSWPAGAKAEPISAADIVSTVAPTAGFGAPLPSPPQTTPAPPPVAAQMAAPAVALTGFGVDIGSALSIQVLRARWLGIRSAHPQLFDALIPTVVLGESAKSKRVELRLVAGPLPNAEAAARLCAALAPFRLYCQPASFGPQHIALE
jgi:hypothetical protein